VGLKDKWAAHYLTKLAILKLNQDLLSAPPISITHQIQLLFLFKKTSSTYFINNNRSNTTKTNIKELEFDF
jgi:hypothetical protein